jgi:hypothetical protein
VEIVYSLAGTERLDTSGTAKGSDRFL